MQPSTVSSTRQALLRNPELRRLLAERQRRQASDLPIKAPLTFPQWLPHASPTFTWDWAFQSLIQQAVGEILRGENDRLILSLPPRHGKSELVTVRLPAHVLEYNPDFRWIIGAYSQTLANKFSRKTRNIARDRGITLSKERRAVDDWETENGAPVPGGLRAAGVGAGVTGMGGHGIIIDDPVKNRAEANSQTYRDATYEWYKDDLFTRLEPGGFIILIMTRWHQDDLAGRILREEGDQAEGGDWKVINLPAIAEDNDPLGRPLDAALCPERYNEQALGRIKKVLGESFFALYQGRPVAAEGNLIKRQWFRYYGAQPAPNVTLEIIQSWDTASKATELSAYSVCTTWFVTRLGWYLVDVLRERMEYPALKRAVINQAGNWKPSAVLIEDKSTGQSLIQELRGHPTVAPIAIEPEGDKITRMSVESVAYESGMVLHPEHAPWLVDFEAELTGFPLAPTADQVDSVSQFLRWARKRAWTFSWDSTGQRAGLEGDQATDIDTSTGWGRVTSSNDLSGF